MTVASKQFLGSPDFLQTIVAETEQNSADARSLATGLNATQLSWTSSPDSWSIAQCLDHLTTAAKAFGPLFTTAIERGHRKYVASSAVAYHPSWVGGWLIKQVAPEARRKLTAPKILRPSQSPASENVLEKFLRQQDEFLRFVREAKGIDYNKTRLRSPVTPLMRYSLADAFVVVVVHEQRHLAQARRVRETSGFPTN